MAIYPWPKGVSGNPNGRPKGSVNPSTFYRKKLFLPNQDRIEKVVNVAFKKALEGEPWAVKLIFETFIIKVIDLEDENVNALIENKFHQMSVEQLEKIREMINENKGTENDQIRIN